MSYNNPIPHTTAGVIQLACSLLFALFCFTYLFCLQGDLLAEAQHVFSNGVTTYYRGTGAVVITIVLIAVQWGVARITRLEGRFYALTFFPSMLILAMLTSMTRETIADFTFGGWYWACPLLLALYALVVWGLHHYSDQHIVDGDYTMSRYLWPNFLTLFVMIVLCGACHKAGDVFMYELRAERYLLKEQYASAADVGRESLPTSCRLNNLRCYALVRQGQLAEHLFDYPQPYGSEGLIDLTDTCSRLHRFNAKDICGYLGALPNSLVSTPEQYFMIMLKMDSLPDRQAVADYYLCGLLLDKKMHEFRRALPCFYDCHTASDIVELPRAYKEALILDHAFNGSHPVAFPDTVVGERYKEYCALADELTDSTTRSNNLHREFGTTLWWHLGLKQ